MLTRRLSASLSSLIFFMVREIGLNLHKACLIIRLGLSSPSKKECVVIKVSGATGSLLARLICMPIYKSHLASTAVPMLRLSLSGDIIDLIVSCRKLKN